MRWISRTRENDPSAEKRSSEAGDTLIEVLLAITILGIAGVALLTGFITSISASAQHRNLATQNTSIRVATDQVTSFLEQNSAALFACSDTTLSASSLNSQVQAAFPSNSTANFTISALSVEYWNGSQFASGTCSTTSPVPQQWTLGITSGGVTTSVSTVIYNKGAPGSTVGNCVTSPTGCHLVFLQVPTAGVVNSNFSPQPIVAIEDNNGNIAAGDVSSVTLSVLTYSGSVTPTPQLSNTCSGIENDGVIAFGDCSLPSVGTYTLKATDSNSGSVTAATMPPASAFSITTAPPARLVLTSTNATGTASSTANIGSITVSEEDAYGNLTVAASPLTVNLSSSSPQGSSCPSSPRICQVAFAPTLRGTAVTSVTIPTGSSSTTFWYGDTTVGTPTLSAASPGLITGTLAATVSAASPYQLAFTSSPFSVVQGTSAANPFSLAMEDQFGNPATSSTSATSVTVSSTSGSAIFSVSANGASSTTLSIAKNASSVTGYYGDNTVGTPTITASSTGLISATQIETILLKPTKLVFSTTGAGPGPWLASSATNYGPITVTEEAASGTPTIIPETVTLTSSSRNGTFSNSAGSAAVTSVSIPAGQSSATFWYGDTSSGTPTITGAAAGLTSASTPLTITPGPVSGFSLSSSTSTPTAGVPFTESITAVDQYGNTQPTYTGPQLLSFSGPSNSPSPANSAPIYPTSVTFVNGVATGANAASVTLFNAQTTPTILTATQVTSTGTATGTSSLTVGAAALSGFLVPTPTAQTAGSPFTVSVTAVDQYDNTITNYGGGSNNCLVFSGPLNSPNSTGPSYPSHGTCTTGQSSLTFSKGVATPSITLVAAQTTTLTVKQGSNSSISGTTGNFVVNSATAKVLSFTNPTGLGPQTAGTAFNVLLTASDTYGNGYSGFLPTSFSGPANSPAPASTTPTYPSSVTFVAGSGTANITLYDAQSTPLTVSSSGASPATSSAFTVNAAPVNSFSLPTPSTQTAGRAFNESITAVDAYDNTTTGYAGSQVLAFTGPAQSPAPTNQAPSYPSSVSFTGGVGTASITLYDAQSTSLTATQTGLTGSTGPFTVTSGSAATLSIPTTPGTQTAGTSFGVTIGATDAYSNPYSGSLAETFSGPVSSPAPASKAPSYPASLTFTNGSATAPIILYNAQPTTLIVAASGATSGNSGTFAVNPAPPNAVAITTQPASPITAGGTVGLSAAIKDQYSNIVNTGTGSADTIGLTLNTGSFAGGTTSIAATNGVANFSALQITKTGTFTITATDTTRAITTATSSSITVTPATENKLVVTAQPPASVTAGTSFGASITIEDQYGNVITTGNPGSNDTVKLALSTGSFAAGTTSVAATNGVATFSGLQVTTSGNYTITASDTTNSSVTSVATNPFTVGVAAANQLVVTTQPASTLTAGQSVTVGVSVEDRFNNVVSSGTGSNDTVSVALSSGTFAGGTTSLAATNGVATFSGLTITNAGSLTITASDTSRTGVSTATTNSINVSPAAEKKLVVTSQPPTTVGAGASFGTTVTLEDQYGNTITTGNSGSNDTVKVALSTGSFASGTTSVAATNGVATFSGLQVTAAGGYTITASDTTNAGVTAATTTSFTVNPTTPSQIVISSQPAAISAGGTVGVGATLEDQYNNVVSSGTGSGDTVSVALSSGSFTSGTTSVAATNGVATFSGLKITTTGSYTITASDTTRSGVSTATTNSFVVSPAAASKVVVTTQPAGSIAAGGTVGLSATIEDQFSNIVNTGTGSADTIGLTLNTGSFAGGTTSIAATNGVANFSALQITKTGTFTITATDTTRAITTATSSSITVTPSTPSQLVVSTQPAGAITAGGTVGLGVTLEDQFNNVVNTGTGSADTVSVALSSGSFASGTTSVAATNGVATFSGLKMTKTGVLSIIASDTSRTGVSTATTNTITVGPATPSQMIISTQPAGSITAGGTVGLGVTLEDQFNNVVSSGTGSNDTVSVALSSGTFAGGTTSLAATNGVATFSGLTITNAGSLTITASDTSRTGVSTATTNSINVSPAAEKKLVVTSQPPTTVGAGASFGTTVTLEDQYGNTITTGNSGSNDTVKVALSTGSFASGTTSVAATNGVATFSGLQVTAAGGYTITASDTTNAGVTAATTTSFTVNPTTPSQIVISSQPAAISAGGTVGVGATLEDQYNNVVSSGTGSGDTVSVALSSGSFTSGTTSVAATNGVATFSGLKITTTGSYTITASDTTRSGVSTATTNSFVVSPAAASKVVVTTQPAGSIAAGGTVGLSATIEDQFSNIVNTGTGSADTIGLTLNTGSFAGGTTSIAATNGVANFSALQITKTGTFTITATDTTRAITTATSSSITVTPSTPSQLVVSTQPAGAITAGGTVGLGVTLEDQFNNVVNTGTGSADTVSVALSSGSFASGTTSVAATNGVATFSGLKMTKTGVLSIIASDTSRTGVSTATTNTITVGPATPSQMIISTQPAGSITAGGTVGLGVTLEDQFNNVVSSGTGSNDTVSVALSSGTFAGGTTSLAATNGVATFSGLTITNAGSLTITASDTSRTGVSTATTNSINVSPAAEKKLVVTSQPAGVTAGGTISLAVSVEDQYGNVITSGTGSTDTVKATLTSGTFNGGTTSVAAVSGVANFTNLVINQVGTYTITASDSTNAGITSATTSSFAVSPGSASQLAFTTQPTGTTGGLTLPVQPAVTVEDQFGNAVTTNVSTATLSIATGTPTSGGPGTLSGCSQTETNGVITFAGCSLNTTGTGYKLKAIDGSLTSATSNSLNITTGPAAQFSVSAPTPSSPTAGSSFTVTITAQDAGGNTVTSYTGAKCLTFTGLDNSPTGVAPTYPSNGTSCSTGLSKVTFANGVASGTNAPTIVPTAAETTSLTATATGLSGTSAPFTVNTGSAENVSATSGAAQTSNVSTSFASPLVATVTDADGNPINNALITFTSPASADGTFASSGCVSNSPTTVCTVDTGTNGQATSSTFTAGGTTGSYNVTASAGSPSTTFAETNLMTATSVASGNGAAVNTVTTNTFSTTSGHTYLITAYETSNQTTTPGTPTLSLPGSASATLLATNTFSGGTNCTVTNANFCYQWAWSFNATSSSGTATVGLTYVNGTPAGSVVDVVALGGNSTSTPIVSGSTTTASGCSKGGCNLKTDTVTANTANAPAANNITLQILASDETMGTAPTWSPATTNLFFRSAASSSLDVNVAIPGVQNESTNASPFSGNDDWGTIALEVEAN